MLIVIGCSGDGESGRGGIDTEAHAKDTEVHAGEVAPALEQLDIEFRYRDIPEPPGVDEIIAGRATRNGVSVDFAILVGDEAGRTPRAPVVPYTGISSSTGIANSSVMTNAGEVLRGEGSRKAQVEIMLDMEDAIYDLIPDAAWSP